MISATILTHNEERNIEKCVRSLLWCDEIVVIDDDSVDKTLQKAVETGKDKVQVYGHPLKDDFAAQHNFALSKAKGDWVLSVDADEIVSEKLAKEIKSTTQNTVALGFYIHRQDHFLGQTLRFGETASIRLLRLAKKNAGIWHGQVHEIWVIKGLTATLKNPLDHYPHQIVSEFISEINHYTDIRTSERGAFRLGDVFFNPVGKFLQNYFLRLGFLDGFAGFVMAFMMSFHSLAVRVKLYELNSHS